MDGKVCIITGGTDGIGYETARALAKRGATVGIVGRNADKGARSVDRIRAEAGHGNVDFFQADLSLMAEVRKAAEAVDAHYPAIHVLMNNAGGYFYPRRETAEGIEYTWALNHLAYFLFTNLLLDKIRESAPARILNASSVGHRTTINFDDINLEKADYTAAGAYQQSKLANIMFTFDLARRLEGTGVTANVFHPGWVRSRFGDDAKGLKHRLMFFIFRRTFMITPEAAARQAVYLASSPEVAEVSGTYWANAEPVAPSAGQARDEAAQRRLWTLCARMTGLDRASTIQAA